MTCAPLKTSAAQKVVNINGEELQEEAGAERAVQRRRVGEAGDAAWDEVLRAKVEAQDALLQSKDALLQAKDAEICRLQADIARLTGQACTLPPHLIPPPNPRPRSLEACRQKMWRHSPGPSGPHTAFTIPATAAEKRECQSLLILSF
jgi:hypothetical protein